jgi:hypothetical protein
MEIVPSEVSLAVEENNKHPHYRSEDHPVLKIEDFK